MRLTPGRNLIQELAKAASQLAFHVADLDRDSDASSPDLHRASESDRLTVECSHHKIAKIPTIPLNLHGKSRGKTHHVRWSLGSRKTASLAVRGEICDTGVLGQSDEKSVTICAGTGLWSDLLREKPGGRSLPGQLVAERGH
jgi:hypothetical protein